MYFRWKAWSQDFFLEFTSIFPENSVAHGLQQQHSFLGTERVKLHTPFFCALSSALHSVQVQTSFLLSATHMTTTKLQFFRSLHILQAQPVSLTRSPCGRTFSWWGCCGLCFWLKPSELALSFLLCSCVYFCLDDPFTCISFHKFSWQLPAFSLFFRSCFCLIAPFSYISLYESSSALT